MSDEKDAKASLPPEARRRGGMDTLFSAAWFDEDAAKANATPGGTERVGAPSLPADEPPRKSNTTMYLVIVTGVMVVFGGLLCTGLLGAAGAFYYFRVMAAAGVAG